MTKKLFVTVFTLFFIITFNACEKEIDERETDELLRLEAFISIHYPDAIKTESGLYYVIEIEGDGNFVGSDDFILYNFTGTDLNEDAFESTSKSIAQLHDIYSAKTHYVPLFKKYEDGFKPLINGLKEGLSYLTEGSMATFIMPSRLAYGSTRYKGLNPYTSVIYHVDLNRIISDPEAYEQEIIDNYLQQHYPELIIDSIFIDGVYVLEFFENEIEEDDEEDDEEEDEEEDEEIHQPINEGDKVTLNYQGRFTDHFLFDTNIQSVAEENKTYDSNRSYEPIEIVIDEEGFIEGFSVALKNLKTNSYAKIIIPSNLAYKDFGTPTIPPYTPLIFQLDIFHKEAAEEEE